MDIWPPIAVFSVLVVAGVYVMAAVEKGWWLPGREGALGKAQMRARWGALTAERKAAQETPESSALQQIATSLEVIATELTKRSPEDHKP